MTKDQFVGMWGLSGEHSPESKWRVWSGRIEVQDWVTSKEWTPIFRSDNEKGFKAFSDFLTSLGHKPIDPRDEVFKRYGWQFKAMSGRMMWVYEYHDEYQKISTVLEDGTCSALAGDKHKIKTAEQAECLCKLMGLRK